MGLNVSQESKGDFELVPEGVYTARCIKVIDLGTQKVQWAGQEKLQPKIMVTWELLDDDVKMKDDRPFAISTQYTASLSEKSRLYGDLIAWRGKAFTPEELLSFDISKLLGAYCQIQVIHNQVGDKTYANLAGIMGTKARPEGVNDLVMFDISKPDMEIFEEFSDYLKGKIRSAVEWNETDVKPLNKNISVDEEDANEEISLDDIPF